MTASLAVVTTAHVATLLPWALVLLLAGNALPLDNEPATVTIDGKRLPVRRALFGINIKGETWDAKAKRHTYGVETASVRYWLRVEGDEHSGETMATRGLGRLVRQRRAWPLRQRCALPGLAGCALRVGWEATYQDGGQEKPLLFEGGAEFTGIFVKVAPRRMWIGS